MKQNAFNSIITDNQWDADPTKIFGLVLVIAGIVGWWIGKPDFQWIVGFGTGLISTGKFSKEG